MWAKITLSEQSRAEQSRAEQSRAEQSRAEQSETVPFLHALEKLNNKKRRT